MSGPAAPREGRLEVDAEQIRDIFLQRLGLRIGPEMSRYVLRRIKSGQGSPMPLGAIPVIACDARTGLPLRRLVDLSPFETPATVP